MDGEQIGKRPIRLVLDDVASDAAVSGERIDSKPIAPIENDPIAIHINANWKGLPAEKVRDIGSLFHAVHKKSGLTEIAKGVSSHSTDFETHQRDEQDARGAEGKPIAA